MPSTTMRINSFLTCLILFFCQFVSIAQTVFMGDTTIKKMTVTSISKEPSFYLISARDDTCTLYTIVSERKKHITHKDVERIKVGKSYKFVLISYSEKDVVPGPHVRICIQIGGKKTYVPLGCNIFLPLNLKGLYLDSIE